MTISRQEVRPGKVNRGNWKGVASGTGRKLGENFHGNLEKSLSIWAEGRWEWAVGATQDR